MSMTPDSQKTCPAIRLPPSPEEERAIASILSMKRIAVVGISDKPERPSYIVAKYLLAHGYEIVPVNPLLSEWEGRKCYPDLLSIPGKVDVVDVFRRPDAVPEIAAQAIEIGAKALWLSEGIKDEASAKKAEAAGLLVAMDRCMKKEHAAHAGKDRLHF